MMKNLGLALVSGGRYLMYRGSRVFLATDINRVTRVFDRAGTQIYP
jgi:hypothetical protein